MYKPVMATAIALTFATSGMLVGRATASSRPPTMGASSYRVAVLPGLGGTSSAGNGINDGGLIVGQSNLAGDKVVRAAVWRDGKVRDLGTLGGPNSAVLWPGASNRGVVVGVSQTADRRTYGESWSCAAFFPAPEATGYRCEGFEWRDGRMRALPTLGGPNGFATGVNDRGVAVGWAETTVRDRTCVRPQLFQFRAVEWVPGRRRPVELRPLPGDTVSAATAIDNRGQVVGISGYCDNSVGQYSAIHAVMWQDGRVRSLGTLGGVAWNTPMAINQRGDVVGFGNVSAAAGGNFAAQAFLWTPRHGIRRLGTLPGDKTSEALGINDHDQVVGVSCDASGACQAFLWQHGVMRPLSSLVSGTSTLNLVSAGDINDAGVITGQAQEGPSGPLVTFQATPR